MDQQRKENSHKSNKTFRTCSKCVHSSTCDRCKGLCIFSPATPDKYLKSRALRQMADQKFFQKEYGLIKTFTHDSDIDFNDERDETFFLLKKFHELNQGQQGAVMKAHGANSWCDRLCQTNKTNKVIAFYKHHFRDRDDKSRRSSRQEKNSNLITFNEANIYL